MLYDTTNTIPRGARYHVFPVALGRGGGRRKEDAKLRGTILNKKYSLTRGLGGCSTDGKNLNEFNLIDQFHG